MTALVNIRSDGFANRRDRVDEGNLHGEERVGRVFDQFRTLRAGHNDGSGNRCPIGLGNGIAVFVVAAVGQWSINLAQHIGGSLAMATDYKTSREEEISDGRGLAQKFRIGRIVEELR